MASYENEIHKDRVRYDARTSSERRRAAINRPEIFRALIYMLLVAAVVFPVLFIVWAFVLMYLHDVRTLRPFRLPFRISKDLEVRDPSETTETIVEKRGLFGIGRTSQAIKKVGMAAGILYLGYVRSDRKERQGEELWLSNDDARTHMFLAGTTGSGKTETNLGLYTNALCWGTGAIYADGKADSSLPFSMWSLARRFGREDDFLLLNFLTGGHEDLAGIDIDSATKQLSQSNTQNPYAYGSSDFLFNLTASLLPEASGDSGGWQEKALNLLAALTRVFCYKRSLGSFNISIGQYRHYMVLENLVELYKEALDPTTPDLAYQPIKSYFETGLPGFNPALVDSPADWDQEVRNQHGYLTGQFSRVLSMMVDTYGFIFDTQYPEVDPEDVLINNRILCVMVPSLEKSPQEAAAVGKLTINSVRLMMARNLGFQVEGSKEEVLDIKQTNSPYPSIIIWDELAYYFAEGIAVMYAQARSLGFMMIAAVQDVQKLMSAGDEGEIGALIGNTKVKWSLALEDADKTYEIFKKAAHEGYFSVLSGHESQEGFTGDISWKGQGTTRVEKQSRLDLDELKGLSAGQGVVIFKDQVVRAASFYIPDSEKRPAGDMKMKINRFLPLPKPRIEDAPDYFTLPHDSGAETKRLLTELSSGKINIPDIRDPIRDRLTEVDMKIAELAESGVDIDPALIGPILFKAAAEYIGASKDETYWLPSSMPLAVDGDDGFDDDFEF